MTSAEGEVGGVASTSGEVSGVTAPGACDVCLRRCWLIARLAGRIEIARHEGRRLREVLALDAETLLTALGGAEREAIADALAADSLPDRLREAAREAGQQVLCRHAPGYPARVLELDDAPAVLFLWADPVAGAAGDDDAQTRLRTLAGGDLHEGPRAVAVVGTRRASAEGLEIARALGRGLSAAGVTVVSGMALGVDAAAHAGALEGGGRTIAVLACGADVTYPKRERRLHGAIAGAGLVLSELPPGVGPRRWTFPARNRLIAALGQMTVVVEAAGRSGSLITAECAADLGREVAALPGPVLDWRSDGTNALLRDGATLVRHTADVLDAVLGLDRPAADVPALEPRLRAVLHEVAGGRDTVAALAGTADRVERALGDLTELELLGVVRRVPGGRYVVLPR